MTVFVEYSTDPIRLTEQGVWMHGDDRIIPRVAELFARHLAVTPEGRYRIVIDRQSAPIEVADTAWFVRSLDAVEDGDTLREVDLTLSDGSTHRLDGSTLMQSDAHVLYCRVPCRTYVDGALRGASMVPCRFPPGLYHQLALRAELEDGAGVLSIAGVRYRFGPYDPSPRPTKNE
ncbi:MAG: hypothetical protein ACAI38_21970 [Myxococcota bacterium]